MGKKPHKTSKSKLLSRSVVKDGAAVSVRRASGKRKANATSFKNGRTKTGGRKAGIPNKTTRTFRELMLAAAEGAGNEMGRDGHVGFLTEVALKYPPIFLRVLADSMPQQLETEQTSPSEDDNRVLHTVKEVCDELTQTGVPPEALAHAILEYCGEGIPEQEHSGTAGGTSSTDDRCVEDDASHASTRRG